MAGFMNAYKRLDNLCRDMNGIGITGYIQDMEKDRGGPYHVSGWRDDYLQLKHYRYIRNQIAHENDVEEGDLCSRGDVLWLENFYQRIMMQKDPLALAYQAKHNCPDRTFARSAKENPKRTIYPGTDEPSDPSKRSVVGASLFLLAVAVVALLLLLTRNH